MGRLDREASQFAGKREGIRARDELFCPANLPAGYNQGLDDPNDRFSNLQLYRAVRPSRAIYRIRGNMLRDAFTNGMTEFEIRGSSIYKLGCPLWAVYEIRFPDVFDARTSERVYEIK